ncbi:MAG: hypothetical protein LAT61_01125 [Alcanivorax sp.]|nr:hypothetical protein [Alcanivorax sp.]
MKSAWQIFAVPMVIAAASLVGLVAALLGEGWMNVVGWVGLAVPVGLAALAWIKGRH